MTFLILLETVIAPVSHEYILKEYYALVKDKRMISKFNWNEFTLKFFLSEIGKILEDGRVREWPHGNLALLQKMIEKMNKTAVFYRTGNMEEEEENLYGDINESTNDGAFGHKEFVYQSDKDNYRTPSQGKINKQKDDDEGKVPYYCTPEYLNSFKGDWSDPIEVPEVSDEKAVTSLNTNEISSHESGIIME
ncbi:Sentrin-specific protease 2 [Hordeum vulgare]|nr:Sentrin-specific protease 2 [Hordeum vulgare]